MTSDKNKGITSVTYKVLGLPETLTTASGVIRNTYDADGRLVRRSYGTLEWVTTDLGFTSHTYQAYREERRVDYTGELTLEDGAVYRRTHEAGWTDAQGREVAAVRDWRGSLRATWTDTSSGNATGGGGTTAPFIPGASAGTKIYGNLTGYYPYGLPWADWQSSDRYLFSGKELEKEHGLFTYDFHARPYDPGLCRFTQPDPLATKYERLNAFIYCAADPITFTDPTGCEFTEALSIEVNKMKKIIDNKILSLESGDPRLTEYIRFNDKIETLRNSKQLYDYATGRDINKDILGQTVFDKETGRVMLTMMNGCKSMAIFAHELNHCYQFEIGEFSLAYDTQKGMKRDLKDPLLMNFTSGLYDKNDERDSYSIQSLFEAPGKSRYNINNVLYDELPDKSLKSSDFLNSSLKYEDGVPQKIMQQISNRLSIVFRYNGETFKPINTSQSIHK